MGQERTTPQLTTATVPQLTPLVPRVAAAAVVVDAAGAEDLRCGRTWRLPRSAVVDDSVDLPRPRRLMLPLRPMEPGVLAADWTGGPGGPGRPGGGLPVMRGGAWDNPATFVRLSARYSYYGSTLRVSDVGFRVVREPMS